MKIPIALSALILALGIGLGWHARLRFVAARVSRDQIVAEAASRGLTPDRSGGVGASRMPRRERHDREAESRFIAAEFIAFAKEWQSTLEHGGKLDGSLQSRCVDYDARIMSLDATQLKTIIAAARSSKELAGEPRVHLLGLAIQALAYQSPQAAVALFAGSSGLSKDDPVRVIALPYALYRWAQNAPLAALAWIRDNADASPDSVTQEAKRQVISGAAAQDPGIAFKFIGELGLNPRETIEMIVMPAKTPDARTATVVALREYFATITDETTREQLLNLNSADPRRIAEAKATFPNWVVSELASDAAREGYESATSWMAAAKLTPAELESFARDGLSDINMHGEAGRWIEWIGATFPRGQTDEGIRNLVCQWTNDDYQAVGKWLDTTPAGYAKNIAVSEYAGMLARYEPATAAQWAMTLPPGAERDATLVKIHDSWPTKTPAAAAAAEAFAKQHGIK